MSRFLDVYPPRCMAGYPVRSSPRWSTAIVTTASGDETVLSKWAHPLYTFTLPEAIRDHSTFEDVKEMWLAMRGVVRTWPWRDPLDFASVRLIKPNQVPQISPVDQVLGTANGVGTAFQLVKRYQHGAAIYERKIHLPVLSTVRVAVGGVEVTTGYQVSRPNGVITFDVPPPAGAQVTAGFLFDVEVRFESDNTFEGVVASYGASGFADIELVEVRPC